MSEVINNYSMPSILTVCPEGYAGDRAPVLAELYNRLVVFEVVQVDAAILQT